ncbi:MAG: ArsR/SmtB family transcription factor [Phycisphaeraceae bacterium]
MPGRLPREWIPQVVERLKALADENRLRLVLRLGEGPRRVTDLAGELGLAQASVSKHLAVLRQAGLVSAERRGTEAIYRIHDPSIFQLCDIVCGGVQRHLREQVSVLTGGRPAPARRERKRP